MLIGVPKEIKIEEYRVGLVPASVREFIAHGHQVIVETNAGLGIGFFDSDYENAGAEIVGTASEIFSRADMVVKVKEPQPSECAMLREGQILFTYLHLAADLAQTKGLQNSGCIAIAYETVTDNRGGLPLLAPMSEVAGRMSVQVGATALQKHSGGRGILLAGVPGVSSGEVVIIGGGVAGTNAMRMALGLEARVTVIDRSIDRLRQLDAEFGRQIDAVYSTQAAIADHVSKADLVIGSVLIPGAAAPKLVTADMIKSMKPGAVVVDIAIDQGGCFETSRPTSHVEPTYIVDDVVHYCVTNMPGAVPRTSTFALNNAVLPFALQIADKGYVQALKDNSHLRNGLNVCAGEITNAPVAQALGLPFTTEPHCLAA